MCIHAPINAKAPAMATPNEIIVVRRAMGEMDDTSVTMTMYGVSVIFTVICNGMYFIDIDTAGELVLLVAATEADVDLDVEADVTNLVVVDIPPSLSL